MSDVDASVPGTESVESEMPWRRMNPLMLLVHPLRELIRYLPVLVLALIAGSASGEPWWIYALSAFGIVVGLLRWFTTSYRITPTHVQVHSGILNRKLLSVPRDRIRSVDVDSTALHRIFGLSVIKVGTGATHGVAALDFNALSTREVPALRAELLRHVAPVAGEDESVPTNYSHWRPNWARFAPLTLSGVASIFVIGVFLLQVQFFENGLLTRLPIVQQVITGASQVSTLRLALYGAVVLIVLASAVAVVRYWLSYAGFSITRVADSSLHISHGLIRTRQITLDEKRLRGVRISEPLSLRVVRAASAGAIMTGVGRERGGSVLLSPPGPRDEAIRVATEVLGNDEPLVTELITHGSRARRRRYTRAATFVGVVAVALAILDVLNLVSPLTWWLFVLLIPVCAVLAWDRYRGLGHALLPTWVVMRSGSLNRRRVVLARDGIIGWTIRRSYFQRRAGLATLIATTAAGRHRYEIPDVPFDAVWPLIEAVSGQVSRTPRSKTSPGSD